MRILGVWVTAYYGPNMPKAVFSVSVFTRDQRFEMLFQKDSCFTRVPVSTEDGPGLRDV